MDYPHHHNHHHHRRSDDEEGHFYPPPDTAPPPYPPHHRNPDFDLDQTPPPPPPTLNQPHYFHSETNYPPTPMPRPPYQDSYYDQYGHHPPPPPQPQPQVTHISHSQEQPHPHHSFMPHFPSFHHHQEVASHPGLDLSNKPTWKVYCKAGPDFHLSIRDGKVVLASADPSDVYQNWYKDEKYSTRVKDEEGCPCFALVNKSTGQAIKHSAGASHPVHLIPYNPDVFDESILWTESKDLGGGYRAIRMVNNVHLNVDAFHGDKKSGGVHDGTTIVLWNWNKGDNQQWKIYPSAK